MINLLKTYRHTKFPRKRHKNKSSQTHIQVEIQINQSTRQITAGEISQENQLHVYHHNKFQKHKKKRPRKLNSEPKKKIMQKKM